VQEEAAISRLQFELSKNLIVTWNFH